MTTDKLHRAKSYPYHLPDRSYLLSHDGFEEMTGDALPLSLEGRTPVIACGSNQSPERLSQKFTLQEDRPIPVIRARLKDFDTVYSAHFASYGSIPATLRSSPGTTVSLFVVWLTDQELDRMHETESVGINYSFGRFDGIEAEQEIGGPLNMAYAYVSLRGALARNGAPVPLARVSAERRNWPGLDQEEILEHAREFLAPEVPLDRFITGIINNKDRRSSLTQALNEKALTEWDSAFTPIKF